MPRFYFHLHHDADSIDDVGDELASLDEAKESAASYARETAAESVLKQGRLRLNHRVDVGDASGAIVHTVWFGDAVRVED